MPLNEANGYPSNLTPQQQREAMQNLYGLGGNVTPTAEQTDLTFEEVERLRRILDRFDKSQSAGRKEFDLARPPVPPYRYQPYPFLMYHHQSGKTKAAHSNDEQTQLLMEGWSVDPFPAEASAPELTAKEQLDAARLDILLKMSPEDFDRMVAESKAPKPPEPEPAKRKKEA